MLKYPYKEQGLASVHHVGQNSSRGGSECVQLNTPADGLWIVIVVSHWEDRATLPTVFLVVRITQAKQNMEIDNRYGTTHRYIRQYIEDNT